MTLLGDLPGGAEFSEAYDLNASGLVVGSATDGAGKHAALWNGTWTILPGSTAFPQVDGIHGVNQAGVMTGSSGLSGACFRYDTATGFSWLTAIQGGTLSIGQKINATGQLSAWVEIGGVFQAVRYESTGIPTALPLPVGHSHPSGAHGINDLGEIAGWARLGWNTRAVVWDASGASASERDPLPVHYWGGDSECWDITDSGLSVGVSRFAEEEKAVLWNAGSATPVDLNAFIDPSTGWELNHARAINESGWIIGKGTRDGRSQAFVLVPASYAGLPPQANAGDDLLVMRGSRATLDGTGSSDPGGLDVHYTWTIVQKPTSSSAQLINATNARPVLACDKKGLYIVELVANDGVSSSAPDRVQVEAFDRYEIVDIPPLPGGATSLAFGINEKGQVVGRAETSSGEIHGILWEAGQLSDLHVTQGATEEFSDARGINEHGMIVGAVVATGTYPDGRHACAWVDGTLELLPSNQGLGTYAYDVNDSGVVVGGGFSQLKWGQDLVNPTTFPLLGSVSQSESSWISAINSFGECIGTQRDLSSTIFHSTHYEAGGALTILGVPVGSQPPGGMVANDLNDHGISVGYTTYALNPSSWRSPVAWATPASDPACLPSDPNWLVCTASATNNAGQIVGSFRADGVSCYEALLWQGGALVQLNNAPELLDLAGWQLQDTRDINDAGWIVGSGLPPGHGPCDPAEHGFLLRPTRRFEFHLRQGSDAGCDPLNLVPPGWLRLEVCGGPPEANYLLAFTQNTQNQTGFNNTFFGGLYIGAPELFAFFGPPSPFHGTLDADGGFSIEFPLPPGFAGTTWYGVAIAYGSRVPSGVEFSRPGGRLLQP